MLLTGFLHHLLTTGAVTLTARPVPFEPADLLAAEELLRAYYADDVRELPGPAPAFDAPAASWAAAYLYHTVQLALVRELDETVVQTQLADFTGEITPAAIYSADLTLRYLPDLLRLAKGLAPGDALVGRLRATAGQWPFSFVGAEEGAAGATEAEARILAHSALQQEYIDRIIRTQDQVRAAQTHLAPLVHAALGQYAATLWPDFAAFSLPA
ncbi:hypothetical protein MON38_10520 [Hymenobacter sp. DH14]|uniref:MoxR-vWA-beta-propeller ternary system domain-containing protein n=1 Tax=Hymenobacter cyanobacteriorum TaxID=2926463 RepID=A0A9X2AIJ7_9BACT|nr:hypothetical protein [Hymenobacter cyanobacteriorum]MCI1187854.1 hypothetical protein [Hymenobacter cyanobacteriorum]